MFFYNLENGEVFVSGSGVTGCLGLGNNESKSVFTKSPLFDITNIVTGFSHTIFMNGKGEVFVCGENDSGTLGIGDSGDKKIPTKLELENVLLFQNNELKK